MSAELLDRLHEIEQKECRIIGRKELHSHFPETMPFAERKKIISAWQSSYFARANNVLRATLRRTK